MEIAKIITIVSAVCAIVFGFFAFRRGDKNDAKDDGKEKGVLLTEVGYIKSGVDDIKRKQEKQDEQHVVVVSRLTAVESSTKQAHHRINELENEIHKN
jgi:hypothetical protein|nr:MAG: Protein of unknown function (DUF2681) [Bacteriophage sp.]UVY65550.1 MAG: Protein of unknown function (DUF2681) [Bacteriophage sp.]DAY66354.1 MAG TPA: hypothetical protein [Caudoviricetes sp.]DAZ82655.1 MAG TPA: hypothetical protein [Caudoviricetes sp.]